MVWVEPRGYYVGLRDKLLTCTILNYIELSQIKSKKVWFYDYKTSKLAYLTPKKFN